MNSETALIELGTGDKKSLLRQQVGEGLFRTDMMLLTRGKFFFSLNAGCNGHEAVEAARVVTAVVILGAVIHRVCLLGKIPRC